MDKKFYERQIKSIKKGLKENYSDDEGKSIHYFQSKGYLQGTLNAYRDIVEDKVEHYVRYKIKYVKMYHGEPQSYKRNFSNFDEVEEYEAELIKDERYIAHEIFRLEVKEVKIT